MNTETSSSAPQPANTAANTQPPSLALLPKPAPAQTRASKPKTRNGRIAHLPKLERDMVNRMLFDGIPQNKIAEALVQRGFKVTPRNVSNWATRGGYRQWCLDQALLVQTRLDQDALTDFLHDDPTRLPEVGLQIMATRLSQTILRSALDLKESLPLVAMLCRISNEILKLHKFRDVRRSIGNPGYQFERQKLEKTKELETVRKVYSGEPVETEKETPAPNYLLRLLEELRSGALGAAARLAHQSTEPTSPPVVPTQPAPPNPKPATSAPVPKPAKKPKSKANHPAAPTHPPKSSPGPSIATNPSPAAPTPTATLSPPASAPCAQTQQPNSTPCAQDQQPTTTPLKSQISDSQLPPDPSPSTTQIKNQNSQIEGSAAGQANSSAQSKNQNSITDDSVVEFTPLRTPLRFIDNVPQPPPPQQCPNCQTPLEFYRDGSPPQLNCPKCNAPLQNLYGSKLERCPACNNPLPPLLANGLRPSRVCAVCGCGLPNPNTPGPHPPALRINPRFCAYCRTPIPWQGGGFRLSAYCAKCHRCLPRILYPFGGSDGSLPPDRL